MGWTRKPNRDSFFQLSCFMISGWNTGPEREFMRTDFMAPDGRFVRSHRTDMGLIPTGRRHWGTSEFLLVVVEVCDLCCLTQEFFLCLFRTMKNMQRHRQQLDRLSYTGQQFYAHYPVAAHVQVGGSQGSNLVRWRTARPFQIIW
jgi:hypothetical protein